MDNNQEKTPAPRKQRKRRKGRVTWKTVLKVLGTLMVIGILTCVMFFGIFMKYVNTTLEPLLDVNADAYTLNTSSVVYYQDKTTGEWVELQKLHGVEDRTLVEFSDIPDHVWQALVAIEDERFFEHNGVDWKSTLKGVLTMMQPNEQLRGGSTLTQQVIKNLTGERETTIKRKVTEIFRALRFAENYSREEVLTLYLNLVYFGNGSYGIQAASEGYFGKDVSELSVAEAASIIGITQYPYKYDPARGDWYREQNKERQINVLYKMNEVGYLTDAEYEAAKEEELVFVWDQNYVETEHEEEVEEPAAPADLYPYLVEQVFNDVVADLVEQKGYSVQTAKDLLYTGGYHIYATIDPELQSWVEEVYSDTENLPYVSPKGEQLQSGMTIIDNTTGNIVAMAGRFGERDAAFLLNLATNNRPCGSAIKPLAVYAPALEAGVITPASVIDDYPVRLQENDDEDLKGWPKNSYTGFKGLITLREALRVSTNTTAVRVLEELGGSASYEFMVEKLGFTSLRSADVNSSALALGGLTYGVSTREMAAAYATFANNGVYTRPRTYVEVRDSKGNVVLENKQESWVAMKETTVYSINDLLKNVVRSGTGTEAAFSGMTIAGKTGTTSNNFDRYFVGYTPYYTAAVWIGYESPTRISASGNPAAQLWKKVMQPVHDELPNADFTTSNAGMKQVTVCTRTGLLQGDLCSEVHTVWVAEGSAPVLTCDAHVFLNVCSEGNALATELCPAECVTSVNAIDMSAPNFAEANGYSRVQLVEPLTDRQLAEYQAQQEADPTVEIPVGTPILANDSGAVLQDLTMKETCTVHKVPEVLSGYYNELGQWVSGYYNELGEWIEVSVGGPGPEELPGEGGEEIEGVEGEAGGSEEGSEAEDSTAGEFLDWLLDPAA